MKADRYVVVNDDGLYANCVHLSSYGTVLWGDFSKAHIFDNYGAASRIAWQYQAKVAEVVVILRTEI